MKRLFKYFLLGLFIGTFSTIFMPRISEGWNIEGIAVHLAITFSIISLLSYILFFINITQLKKAFRNALSGDEEDELHTFAFKKYYDAKMAGAVSLLTALITACIAIIVDVPFGLLLFIILILFIAISSSFQINKAVQIVYKDRQLPHVLDKTFSDKLFKSADQGERHVFLDGYYSSFKLMNILLPLAVIALSYYSKVTGENQLFSIIIILIITIVLNAQYILKVRAKS